MNKQKQNYVAPEAQTLVVGFEGMICTSTIINAALWESGSIQSGTKWDLSLEKDYGLE